MKKLYTLIILLCVSSFAFATHEIAGQITIKCLQGNTYEMTVVTYTRGTSTPADRCHLNFLFGDGDSAIVCRSNFENGDPTTDPWGANGCTGNPNCSTIHMGEWNIGSPTLQSMNLKKNVFTTTHTYPGPGVFIISVSDPLFEDIIVNLPPQQAMTLIDTNKIFNAPGFPTSNNNAVYGQVPFATATLFQPFTYNPMALDPDGDSLSYSLIPPPGTSGYVDPPASSSFGINAFTGVVTWDAPYGIGKYIFCVAISEWAMNSANGKRYPIGSSMQIVSINVISAAGVAESNEPVAQISTSPSPSAAEINFTISGGMDYRNCSLQILDYSGRMVKTIGVTGQSFSLDTQGLSSGMYSYCLSDQKQAPICGKIEITH